MTFLDYFFLGLTLFIALLLADLCSSAIKWQLANYKLRKEIKKRKHALQQLKLRIKTRFSLTQEKPNELPRDK